VHKVSLSCGQKFSPHYIWKRMLQSPNNRRCHLIGVATKKGVNMLKKQISRNKIEKFQEATTSKCFIYDVRVANILHRPDLVREIFGNGSGKDD
jgi:hypothetical protein